MFKKEFMHSLTEDYSLRNNLVVLVKLQSPFVGRDLKYFSTAGDTS